MIQIETAEPHLNYWHNLEVQKPEKYRSPHFFFSQLNTIFSSDRELFFASILNALQAWAWITRTTSLATTRAVIFVLNK